MIWRASRLRVSSRGARPKPPRPRAVVVLHHEEDRPLEELACHLHDEGGDLVGVAGLAQLHEPAPQELERPRLVLRRRPSPGTRRRRPAAGFVRRGGGTGPQHRPLGERGSTSARQLRGEGRESASNCRGLSLLRVGLKTKDCDPHLPRAQAQRLVEALGHHQDRRAQVHLPQALDHLEAALERGPARGRHAEVGHEDERAVPPARSCPAAFGGTVGVARLDDLEARRP